MADRGDTHYHVPHLNLWFTVSSIVLLITAFWMVIDDWSRPWKRYQAEFRRIEVRRAKEVLEEEPSQAALAEEVQLSKTLVQAQERLKAHTGTIDAAKSEQLELKAVQFKATEAEKKAKQNYNWERFLVDEFRAHHGDDDEGYGKKLEALKSFEDEMARLGNRKKEADAAVVAQEEKVKGLGVEVSSIEKSMKKATKEIDKVREKLAVIAPEDRPTQIANIIRDFPGLDFIGPSLKVNKVLPPNLTFELNFTQKPRIDMCQSCHLAADRVGYGNEEQPFTSHPDLDLYLLAKSPHPLSEFGCTICHRGAGEALDFQRADHRASSEEQAHEWGEKYHWHKQHYWDYPMLPSNYIEASCVQCHKDTLDLIEPAAPKVVDGFRLFERYGCYACHKVEWFPTKRRPGPTLAAIRQKTNKEFINSWIADPKAFRPTTWMPQIFHLENYGPDVTVVHSKYGTERAMMGPEWSDSAVASVASFIWSRSTTKSLPPMPHEGDVERGRELFLLSGCVACHNTVPFEGQTPKEYADDEEFDGVIEDRTKQARGPNEHGPNLRGIATKVTPDWLFQWIKNPAVYWPETRMPDLRLSDRDAADIVAYVFDDPLFADVPDGWAPEKASYKRDVLEEQARWFFNRILPAELDRRFKGEWSDDRALLEAVGEKWVLNQGCHSCHEISGLEDAQPIGTELTTWASKTIDKLDFGFLPEILAEKHGWDYGEKSEFKEYRENFLEHKLRTPRAFDRRKVKNPTERLRMPLFEFNEDQIESIVCFVDGLVEDEVQLAKMVPTPAELAMDIGLRAIRQKNCAGCHVIEPALVEFVDEDDVTHRVRGSFLPIDEEFDPLPPPAKGDFQQWLSRYEEAWEDEVPEIIVRLEGPEPGLGDVGSTVIIEDTASVRIIEPAWGGELVPVITDYYLWEEEVEDVDGVRRSYYEEAYEKLRWTFAPPVLLNEGAKLQREWFFSFLLDPVQIRKQIRVKMPSFQYGKGEAGAIVDYFANRANLDWPARYAKKFMVTHDQTPASMAEEIKGTGIRLDESELGGIAAGNEIATATGLSKLLQYAEEVGFRMDARTDPAYEVIPQRTRGVLEPILEADPGFFGRVHNLVTGEGGPNCIQCHFLRGTPPTQESTPVAWAPDLDQTRERLRPEWVRQWMIDPGKVYPGTTMPANFSLETLQWQDYIAAPSEEQIEAVLLWLYNLDRAEPRN
jgi:cbb3-type cytochrome oxidase cytochrome c subunit